LLTSWRHVIVKVTQHHKIMFKQHGVCPMLSITLFKIFLSKYVWMALTFRVKWSHWARTSSRFRRDNRPQAYWCYDLNLFYFWLHAL